MSITVVEDELVSQRVISEEIEKLHADARAGETQPRLDFPPYRSAILRHPVRDLRYADPEGAELFAPAFGRSDVAAGESDLTTGAVGEPIGERIAVHGRVLDGDGRPVRRQLVEIWQANAAGRYAHQRDQHPAPLDPNFTGTGRYLTDDAGWYSFTTIKPGPYPWHNHRMLHTENGMLGMGPEASGPMIDSDLINAGKVPVTELPGASYFHHADSFAMMRGGHLDICVSRVYTDLAVFEIQPGGVAVRDLFGIDFATLTSLVSVPLIDRTQEAAP